jgi:predicted deacetylase
VYEIKPILAVVPDNQDYDLQQSLPDPEFWDCMRRLEAAGATIGLHGYQHLCLSKGKSLLPLHRHTEFSGVAEETQRKWIHAGLEILRGHGLNPRIWVAPRHGFDRTTLRVLSQQGISLLSDGFARVPFTRDGFTWIPQQLWAPLKKAGGLWTICIHSNTANRAVGNQLRSFLNRHAEQFTSVDRVLAEIKPVRLGPGERIYEAFALARIRASILDKRVVRALERFRID